MDSDFTRFPDWTVMRMRRDPSDTVEGKESLSTPPTLRDPPRFFSEKMRYPSKTTECYKPQKHNGRYSKKRKQPC